MAIRINGKEVAAFYRQRIKAETERLYAHCGKKPCLAVVLVGSNPASISYVNSKKAACDEMGFDHSDYTLEENTEEDELLSLIDDLNKDDKVDGIRVYLMPCLKPVSCRQYGKPLILKSIFKAADDIGLVISD